MHVFCGMIGFTDRFLITFFNLIHVKIKFAVDIKFQSWKVLELLYSQS